MTTWRRPLISPAKPPKRLQEILNHDSPGAHRGAPGAFRYGSSIGRARSSRLKDQSAEALRFALLRKNEPTKPSIAPNCHS